MGGVWAAGNGPGRPVDPAGAQRIVHWDVSSTGYGRCPRGQGRSLDPHWWPDDLCGTVRGPMSAPLGPACPS
jgi:hypothetical protein